MSDAYGGIPDREICTPCDKRIYVSQRDAQTFLNHVRSRRRRCGHSVRVSNSRDIPKAAYECPAGNGWHITRRQPGHTYGKTRRER